MMPKQGKAKIDGVKDSQNNNFNDLKQGMIYRISP